MQSPTLSICLIARNEEDVIARCLQSIKPIADEIIVVDTGSTDRTIEICQEFGATVLRHEWQDHFSLARNYGLEQASGEWIMWMDADEEMDVDDRQTMKNLLPTLDKDIYSIHLVNYIGATVQANESFHIAHARLFRNHKGFKFQFSIHETLNVHEVLPDQDESQIDTLPVKVYHYGYLNDVTYAKNKSERNITLLLKAIEAKEPNPWLEYHLASEYSRMKQYDFAFKYVNWSIVRFLSEGLTPPSLVYKLKYSILLETGSIEGAWPAIDKVLVLYPDYVDLHLYKGVILHQLGKHEQALETFDHCIALGDKQLNHLTLHGSATFHAYYYKGQCYEQLNQPQDAWSAYRSALNFYPEYGPANLALQQLLVSHPDLHEQPSPIS
ncbi:glycosyltransferase [Paenibacillus popilliae]|uniref:Glycosyltransferase n=1 Tax=Paenibacillus popilliae TaxID=78057 RepID=A0ABY3AWA2_PAEPP|nr:glycosyltransferase [Paenibacillus sp. SDF0028]TQR46795.1 glycosyltransferase [Paenibacillus sp. SDF0028]